MSFASTCFLSSYGITLFKNIVLVPYSINKIIGESTHFDLLYLSKTCVKQLVKMWDLYLKIPTTISIRMPRQSNIVTSNWRYLLCKLVTLCHTFFCLPLYWIYHIYFTYKNILSWIQTFTEFSCSQIAMSSLVLLFQQKSFCKSFKAKPERQK